MQLSQPANFLIYGMLIFNVALLCNFNHSQILHLSKKENGCIRKNKYNDQTKHKKLAQTTTTLIENTK